MKKQRFTVDSFLKAKKNDQKISMLTAYDYSTAKLLDEAGVDSLLVGDSLGMVMLGYENTLQVTMEDMVHHCRAVSRGAERAMIIGDMPFLSYHISVEESVRNAGRLVQQGHVQAVKLEGGSNILDNVKAIVKAQIPVMGHLGLTPQSVNMFGGFKVQGREEEQARKIAEEALRLQDAGVFALVLECVPEQLAKIISGQLDIPTIGIGAGKYCDGQVLVMQDMLGMYTDITPKFVKKYADLSGAIKEAVTMYIDEMQTGVFPGKEHSFQMDAEVIAKLY
ncbi:MAG: 3-methyl-2-oxobutanoate hydroxymethyltransferase [Firmicutes bacterium]|nr:3-methyl-2-oxobutanoate hydroxymethyltransferase [Bacillota bacterium]